MEMTARGYWSSSSAGAKVCRMTCSYSFSLVAARALTPINHALSPSPHPAPPRTRLALLEPERHVHGRALRLLAAPALGLPGPEDRRQHRRAPVRHARRPVRAEQRAQLGRERPQLVARAPVAPPHARHQPCQWNGKQQRATRTCHTLYCTFESA